MKMNINKVCDLKSISVFPPNLRRRSSVGPSEPQASQQQQQRRSQSFSQQSFSQAPSSQRGCLSQMTQSSIDELLINEQRFNSQERDLSLKKVSCLPPISHKREDSQLAASRSSSVLTRRWSSDSKSQISEELEQRFGVMETSLSKFGMMLDSIQSDIMQANRGTKEVFHETERIQQKLILQDTSLQKLIKEQTDVKASLDGGIKSILEEISKDPNQEKLQKIFQMLETTIPKQIETSLQNIQREICHTFTKEIQVLANLKMPEPRIQVPIAPQVKVLPNLKMPEPRIHVPIATQTKAKENLPGQQRAPPAKVLPNSKIPEARAQAPIAPQAKAKENFPVQNQSQGNNAFSNNATMKTKQPQLPRNPYNTSSRTVKRSSSPKIQVGNWKTVKPEQSTFKKRAATKQVKSEFTHTQPEQCHIVIDSDEDLDAGFSCLLDGNTKGVNIGWDAEKETEKILRLARRTKRKFSNPIIIN